MAAKGRFRQRPPAVPLTRENRFRLSARLFKRTLNECFPIEHYQDSLGRNRSRGHGVRARVEGLLRSLVTQQAASRSGIVYAGYEKLGRFFPVPRSRSTAYRAKKDAEGAGLIRCFPGGGKTRTAEGELVAAANGYRVPAPASSPLPSKRLGPGPQASPKRDTSELVKYVTRWKGARAPGVA